jgi:hypothetical protein
MKDHGIIIEKPETKPYKTQASVSPKRVMLALSSYSHSDKMIRTALENAKYNNRLVIVYAININPSEYFVGTDIGFYPEWKKECIKDLFRQYILRCRGKIHYIANQAMAEGIQTETFIRIGRFVPICLNVIKTEKPFLVITKRPLGPALFRRIFHSPADRLIRRAGCEVIEV